MTRKCRLALALSATLVATPLVARAQQPAALEPMLRTSIEPPRIVVGQKATLTVEVLAPNYLTAPPELPDFQVRNAVTRRLQSLNLNEQHGGTTYAGVRFAFAIYPQEPGAYLIADQKVALAYADDPPKSRQAVLSLPRIELQAFIPDAAARLDPFVAAASLAVEQVMQQSADHLKVGDAVTRIVTIRAKSTPAMLLPPVSLSPSDGLALYPAQPVLEDKVDARTDELSATRQDKATYMLQQPGDYVLPAIEVAWWNVRDQKIERARADVVTLQVAANPALVEGERSGEGANPSAAWRAVTASLLQHWPAIVASLVALVLLAGLSPRLVRTAGDRFRERRDAYRRSEAASFARLREAARTGDASVTYFALLAWLARFEPLAPGHSAKRFAAAAQDPELDRQLALMETRLFAPPGDGASSGWSARHMVGRIARARRRLLRSRSAATAAAAPALPALNPADSLGPVGTRLRPVAR